jgi:hypothetical protein
VKKKRINGGKDIQVRTGTRHFDSEEEARYFIQHLRIRGHRILEFDRHYNQWVVVWREPRTVGEQLRRAGLKPKREVTFKPDNKGIKKLDF